MTTTPSLTEKETTNDTKTLPVSSVEQVLATWTTYTTHAAASHEALDTVSHLYKALSREQNALAIYCAAWKQYYDTSISDQDFCCLLLESQTHLAKARRSWDMVVTKLQQVPEPQSEHFIHERWYLEELERRSVAACQRVADLARQVENDLRPYRDNNVLNVGFLLQVHRPTSI